MGKLKQRHNWKARQNVKTKIDKSEQEKIKLDTKEYVDVTHDDSNALVLPSKKRATKVKAVNETVVKRLSKKQRKKLQKVIDQKEKKQKRAGLLDKLQSVQVTPKEMKMFTSISEMYSGRPKTMKRDLDDPLTGDFKINAIAGSKKRKKLKKEESSSEEDSEEDPTSSSEEDSEDMEEGSEDDKEAEEQQSQSPDNKTTPSAVESGKVEPSQSKVTTNPIERKPAVHIPLDRKAKIQEQRLALPILAEEQGIMEAINDNPVVVLCGETGSGKTTQVPQFLYEAGYAHGGGIIGVTEPRRVAAVSMSKRVGDEMNLSTREVSYQIRYDGNVTEDTKIKFMTDGVLLKEVQNDFLLKKYKVLIIDEAHERSVFTDILIGLLSRIVPLRHKKGNPLKLIIMSATLRVEDFTENPRLFKPTPPVIKVAARQFPVSVHFNKRTLSDYLGEAYKKVCKIHRQLPEGGILVFVTGQQEVHTLCAKLRRSFPFTNNESEAKPSQSKPKGKKGKPSLPDIKLDDYSVMPLDEEADLYQMESGPGELSDPEADLSDDDGDKLASVAVSRMHENEQPMYVLPLYSLLSPDRQAKVFEPPPEGSRLCIVSTNVAETSLTIPSIKYVVDTGKVKTKFYDKVTGVSAFRVTWTSQSGANQRAGRSGRTGPGHTYRLYSSAVFSNDFEKFSEPEISQRPVDDLVLLMKDMHIDKVINFPFPTPPNTEALKAAEKLLISLGALKQPPKPKSFKETKETPSTQITALGKAMASFPVSPRYGKMLSLGSQHKLLPYVVAIVAALSVQEMFLENRAPVSDEEKEQHKQKTLRSVQIRRNWAGTGHSLLLGDLMVMLKAVGAWEFSGGSAEFCENHGLRYKAMVEIRKLRAQLTNALNAVLTEDGLVLDPQMAPPTDLQAKLLRQIILSGLGDHVARRLPEQPKGTEEARKMKNAFQSLMLEEPVFIHPGSVLYKTTAEYVVYQSIDETSKLYMKGVSGVEPEWLPVFVPSHCQFSKPAEDPGPRFDDATGRVLCHMGSTFGPHFRPMPAVEVDYPDTLDKYKWFGKFFLEGSVSPALKKFTRALLTAPVTMIKSWSKLQPRTEVFLNELVAESVCTKEKLLEVWSKDPKYLLKAYKDWLPQALSKEVTAIWPPT